MTTNTMTSKVMMMKTRFAALGLLSTMLLGLSGCPLQTSAVAVGVSGGAITISGQTSPAVKQNFVLTATAKDASTSLVGAMWTSSDPATVEIVSSTGATASLSAKKVGQVTITVRAGDKSGTTTVTVIQSVKEILVEGPLSLNLGDEPTYTAKVTDDSGKTVTVPVSWNAVGSVELVGSSSPGKVKTRALGAGSVSASAGGMTGTAAVNVLLGEGKLAVAQPDGSAFPAMIASGQSVSARAQYSAKSAKVDATDAQWSVTGGCTLLSSSGANVQVRGNTSGTCTVTVSARGMTAMASFSVITVTAIKITGDTTSVLKLGATRMLTAVAQAGTTDIASVPVVWTQTNGAVTVSQTGNVARVTGAGVGQAALRATVGAVVQNVAFAVEPVSLEIASPGLSVVMGGGATVTVTPKGMNASSGKFITADGVALTGASGFTSVGPATLTDQGLVTFALTGATAGSPSVKATFGAVTSNALAFTLATVTKVVVMGPVGPVRVGSDVKLEVLVTDAQNMPIAEGGLPVTWADASGTLTLPAMSDGFSVNAVVAKLGTTSVVATVKGIASAPYAFPGVPNSVIMSEFTPGSIPVGGTATATIEVRDTKGNAIPGVPASEVTVTSADPTKVTVSAAVANGNVFTVTATGVAAAGAPGVGLTAKWMRGNEPVMGTTQQLIVAASQVAWEGSCVASPLGPKTWRVSGFQGATSSGNTIVYDIYAALGGDAMTNSSKVAMDAASGVAKDVTVTSAGADWHFGVVARASDGATSRVVACTRGATVASPTVATSAIVLSGAGVYADDTTMAVAATNPRALLMVAPEANALVRTAPRQSISFGGGLVGIGVRAAGDAQILYKRVATGQGADASVLPAALAVVKTDSSNGICTSRAGLTAFELSGKVTAAGALTSFALDTSAGTATGDAADCALNVLALREGATKTNASGVDRVAAFGDHRLGYTYAGALFDVDLTTASKVPRLLADDGLAAGSLIAGVSPTTGTAGAIEATSIYVLSPTGVVSRYTMAAPPLVAPVASAATAALANADGFVALDADTLLVTSGGTLKVVEVSGAGPLTLGVTARDYSSFGAPAFAVTLGASPLVAQ
jgi:hypothetical protein